jgi:hypothetical protein
MSSITNQIGDGKARSLSDIRKHGKFGAHIWLRINDLDSAPVI